MTQVLFPLLSDLSPGAGEGGGSGGGGGGTVGSGDILLDLEEQRVALITTITRTFKKHIGTMAGLPDFHSLWLKLVCGAVVVDVVDVAAVVAVMERRVCDGRGGGVWCRIVWVVVAVVKAGSPGEGVRT